MRLALILCFFAQVAHADKAQDALKLLDEGIKLFNDGELNEARDNFARAGLTDRVSVVVGDAQLKIAKVSGPFDLIFQDGAKKLYSPLLDRLVALLRPGGLLITDNVLWDGEVVPGYQTSPRQKPEDTQAIVEYNKRVASHPNLLTSIVPLRDGVSISVKTSGP